MWFGKYQYEYRAKPDGVVEKVISKELRLRSEKIPESMDECKEERYALRSL
jgi:hypothetical protein